MRALVVLLVAASPAAAQQKFTHEFFETKIRPVLAEHCYSCHGAKKQQAGLRLDNSESFQKGGDDGPIVTPGQPDKSSLLRALRYEGDIRMPPKGKLPENVVADFSRWIQEGARWPQDTKGVVNSGEDKSGKNHWAFQPVKPQRVPTVSNPNWVRTPIDAFILAKLDEKRLTPNPQADRRTLLRRAKIDLVGLPPTEAEIAAFEQDRSPDAWAKVVDHLLDSPQYGERWARHWLDLSRYADTKGYVFQEERRYAFAYTYRDWVVKALNDDMPFNRFVELQIAADRLAAKKLAEPRDLAAMGFLTLGRRFLNNVHDVIDDRIDVVGRGLLGLTINCARCHDHKYDPIPTKDYYSLYGVFASSSEPKELPLLGEPERTPEYEAYEAKLNELKLAVKVFEDEHREKIKAKERDITNKYRDLQKKVDGFQASSPFAPPRAMVMMDNPQLTTPVVFLRGNANNRGPQVPRQFLEALTPQRQPFTDGSGRLELARAITNPNNPLTARVLVNRLWQHHFGEGLVDTPSNFGLRADPPSHPELLDFLAQRFMADGWSIKKMHRLMLLSNVYQVSDAENAKARAVDPENRLLAWRSRLRFDFETLRDSLLFVSGSLDPKMGGPSVDITKTPYTGRRTLYAFIDRQNLPGVFRTFDFASPDATTATRFETTVPQQSLFLLNSPFVLEQSRKLLQRPEIAKVSDASSKIEMLYRTIYARRPDAEELSLGLGFVSSASQGNQSAWERYGQVLLLGNEFVFVD